MSRPQAGAAAGSPVSGGVWGWPTEAPSQACAPTPTSGGPQGGDGAGCPISAQEAVLSAPCEAPLGPA